METDNGEDTGRPGTIGSVKIEWNQDFDNRWHEMKSIGSGDEKYTFGNPSLTRLPSTRLLSTGYEDRIAQVALQTR